jgi:hypothetical protein
MDFDGLLRFFTDYFIGWSRVTLLTLARPISRFELTPANDLFNANIAQGDSSEQQLWLSQRLLTFAVVSIVLGITINALIPGRMAGPGMFTTVAVILV